MLVAKRQRREKTCKNRTKESLRTRVRTSGETTAFLASPVYIGQAQVEEKKTEKEEPEFSFSSLLFATFGSSHPHASRMYFPLLSK